MKIGIATCAEKADLTAGDRDLASCLTKRGFEVAPVIWNGPESHSGKWDSIVLRSTWDYHLDFDRFASWVSEIERFGTYLVNSATTVRWNWDKSYLAELAKNGIATVPSLFIPSSAAKPIANETAHSFAVEQIRKTGWNEVVLKPTISATSFLTFRTFCDHPSLPSTIEQIKQQSNILVQPYLPSIAKDGEVSLIFFNGQAPMFSHAVLKRAQAGEFRVQSEFGGSAVLFEPETSLIAFAETCLRLVPGEWAFARVDLVDWKSTPLLSELELIEPELFVSHFSSAAHALADAITYRLGNKLT